MDGIRWFAIDGDSRTPLSAKYSSRVIIRTRVRVQNFEKNILRSPMKRPAPSLKVKEKPQRNHCIHYRYIASIRWISNAPGRKPLQLSSCLDISSKEHFYAFEWYLSNENNNKKRLKRTWEVPNRKSRHLVPWSTQEQLKPIPRQYPQDCRPHLLGGSARYPTSAANWLELF